MKATPPKPGQRVLATDKNPTIHAGFLFGHVIEVRGNRVLIKRTTGKTAWFDWNAPDGVNPWVRFEDEKQ